MKYELNAYREDIDKYINDYFIKETELNKHGESLMEAVRYAYNTGGKRIRPIIMLMISDIYGIDREIVMPYAAALEMIHSYSLIHDDLPSMDDDDFRRGQLTVHKKFGEAIAVLSGDYLLNAAGELVLENIDNNNSIGSVRAFKYLYYSSGISGMLGGQIMDIADEVNMEMSELKKMYELKTGALFKSATTIPGYLCDMSNEDINKLTELGKLIGMTFQLVDDVLDKEEDMSINKVTLISSLSEKETRELIDKYYLDSKNLMAELKLENSNLDKLIDDLVNRSV